MPRLRSDQPEIGFVERALAGLVDHRLAFDRIELGNDVVARLAAHQDAAHGARVADALGRRAALDLGGRRVGQIRPVALAGVNDQHAGRARGRRARPCTASTARCSSDTSLPSVSPKPPGSRKSRCMSMMTSAVRSSSTVIGCGSAAIWVFIANLADNGRPAPVEICKRCAKAEACNATAECICR